MSGTRTRVKNSYLDIQTAMWRGEKSDCKEWMRLVSQRGCLDPVAIAWSWINEQVQLSRQGKKTRPMSLKPSQRQAEKAVGRVSARENGLVED